MMGRAWTAEEDAVVREVYARDGAKACAATLAGRSLRAVLHRARKLGVTTHRRWTAREDRMLSVEWGVLTLGDLAERLGRTELAVYHHAQQLGITGGAPEGFEYLSAAANRTGYATIQLRRILRAGGVRVRRALARPRDDRPGWHFHFVDSMDVDDAVAAWLAGEDLEVAARRHGVCGETLARWLREAGVPDRRRRAKQRWRVPSDTIDRVVAERRALVARTLTQDEAAARFGVTAPTLSKWLKEAGVSPNGKPWRLDPDVVARVVAERIGRPNSRAPRAAKEAA